MGGLGGVVHELCQHVLYPPQGVLISLDKMDRLLDVDVSSCTVKVQAGIRLEVLHEVLDKYGLAMRNLGSISEQSIAGALATGTHGTGSKFGILASFVKGVKIMGADGQVWNCQSGGEHHALFKAAQCHLGVLGILLEVDIACEPAFFLRAIQQPSTLSSVLDNLDVLVDSAEHWRFWWFPHTSNCITWAANRMHGMSKEEKAVQLSRNAPSLAEKLRRAFVERLLGFHTFRVLLFLGKFIPGIIPTVNRFFFWLLFSRRRELCDRSDRVFNIDCLFQQYVDEWSIPREHTAEALRALERMVVDRGWKVHFPVEVRFVQGDDIPLSTCYGRDSCFIGVIMYRPFGFDPQDVQEYLMAFEKVMARLGGRPHWAKSFHFRRADFEKCYPRFAEFERVREQLDPEGLFDNDFSRNVFGQRAGEREQQDPSAVKK